MVKNTLTQEEVRIIFDYVDGKLLRDGKASGGPTSNGYHRVSVKGKSYRSHRLVYLYHHGYIPEFVDHINRDRMDNRIENLRECTRSQNNRNATKMKGTDSKYLGVIKYLDRWRARICIDSKMHHLGYFKAEDEAALAYDIALLSIDPEFGLFNFNKENYHRQA